LLLGHPAVPVAVSSAVAISVTVVVAIPIAVAVAIPRAAAITVASTEASDADRRNLVVPAIANIPHVALQRR
jgi:hypothetical protein